MGAGQHYLADVGNNAIRKVEAATGIITTVPANAPLAFPATAA